jgi:hypothetical protein
MFQEAIFKDVKKEDTYKKGSQQTVDNNPFGYILYFNVKAEGNKEFNIGNCTKCTAWISMM